MYKFSQYLIKISRVFNYTYSRMQSSTWDFKRHFVSIENQTFRNFTIKRTFEKKILFSYKQKKTIIVTSKTWK